MNTKGNAEMTNNDFSTLDSTCALFFDTEPDTDRCEDCGSKTNLTTILYTTEAGNSARVCPECKTKRAVETKAAQERAVARRYEREWRNDFEEYQI